MLIFERNVSIGSKLVIRMEMIILLLLKRPHPVFMKWLWLPSQYVHIQPTCPS